MTGAGYPARIDLSGATCHEISPCCVRLACAVFLAFAAAACAWAHKPPEQVRFTTSDPEHFTEARRSFGIHRIGSADYLKPLKAYIIQRAAHILGSGQRLDIEVTDVDLAGEYEPWLGPISIDVRIVKRIYPPRIDLHFTLYGANGEVLRDGSRKLRDPAFISRGFGQPTRTRCVTRNP